MRYPRSLRSRLLLLATLIATVAIILATLGFNTLLRRSLSADATTTALTRARDHLAELGRRQGQVVVSRSQEVFDHAFWVFQGGTAVEEPRAASPILAGAARGLGSGAPGRLTVTDGGRDYRMVASPITDHGRRIGAVVAAVPLRPYDETADTALRASVILGAALLACTVLGGYFVLRQALRPVDRMTATAAAWSEDDLDRRFAVGAPVDELGRLGETFDSLLGRLAASLRRERRLSAEVSHELRTPLTKISTVAELALRRERDPESYRESLRDVLGNARQLGRMADALMASARSDANPEGAVCDAREVAVETARTCIEWSHAPTVAISVEPSAVAFRVRADRELVSSILRPVFDNALSYGRRHATVSLAAAKGMVEVVVADDGPGVLAEENERIFMPGERGAAAEALTGRTGSGLGLSLSRRMAQGVGGDVTADPSSAGGHFVVRLPAA